MPGASGTFLLGLLCGATGLIALYSALIGVAYRDRSLGWLTATLVVGMLPVVAELGALLEGLPGHFPWGRPAAWATVALAAWSLREVLGHSAAEKIPSYGLLLVALLTGCAALVSLFFSSLGLSVVLGPLWLCMAGLALYAGWVRFAPWIYWIAAGQLALLVGWVGVLVLLHKGFAGGDLPSVLWKSFQLTLYGATTYIALVWRSRMVAEVRLRAQAVERADPLTGMALPGNFEVQVDSAMARARTFGYRNALLDLQVSNLDALMLDYGLENNELALVAASSAITTVLRDVDVAARMGSNRFVVLVEGMLPGETVTDVATRYIASGLRADPVRGLRLTIKFRCIAWRLPSATALATDFLQRLEAERAGWDQSAQPTAIRVLDPEPVPFQSSP